MRRAIDAQEAEKGGRERWRAGRLQLEIRWSGKASLETVTLEPRLEGSNSQYSEGTEIHWVSGVKSILERKIKVKTLRCSWRKVSRDR